MPRRPTLALYLDTRSKLDGSRNDNSEGKHSVKLRLTWPIIGTKGVTYKVEYYVLKVYLSPTEFQTCLDGKAKTPTLKAFQAVMIRERAKAQHVLDNNPNINHNQFAALYAGQVSADASVTAIFKDIMKEKLQTEKDGTAATYKDALASLVNFNGGDLLLTEIDRKWLQRYERDMVAKGKSLNTVGIYLRNLRAAFNRAMTNGLVTAHQYPFGKQGGYQIRKMQTKKRALSLDFKNSIVAYKATTPGKAKAIDFLLFSYWCNGMNFTDIAYLREDQFYKDHFVFVRRKTMNTVSHQKQIQIYITPEIQDIIDRRGGHKGYVFGIISDKMTAAEKKLSVKNWVRLTNKHARAIAKALGFKESMTTYSMRHTFTTALVNGGIPLTKVKDSLGHTSILTTQAYAEDLDLDTSKTFSKYL